MSVGLLFNAGCKAPLDFYMSVFPDAELTREFNGPHGELVAASIRMRGVDFVLISGGPECEHSVAASYMIYTKDQAETDYFWDRLSAGGEQSYCGWLSDQFGVWWQVTPTRLTELTANGTPEQAQAAFGAMMKMQKIIIADIEAAAANV